MKSAVIVGNQNEHHVLEIGTEVEVISEPYVYHDRFMGDIIVVNVLAPPLKGEYYTLEQTIIEEDLKYV